MTDRPYVIVCHAAADACARIAAALRDLGGVDCVARLDGVADLLALAAADCLVVDLPETASGRAALGRIVAAYPETHVVVIAASLAFDDVRDVLRLGIRDIVPVPVDPAAIASAVREGLAARAVDAPGLRGTAILVASGKGGAGCTALALHLAAALARHGTAALVDADAPPFGATAAAADLDSSSSIAGLVRQHLPIEPRLLRRVGLTHAAGFTVFSLWGAAGEADDAADVMPVAMDALTAGVPFVVVDLGRPVLPAQRMLSRRAGVAVAVATLDLLALRSLRYLIDLLVADGVTQILPVLNRSGGTASYTIEQAEAALGTAFAAVLPETPRLSRCLDDGALIGPSAPDDPWWRGIEALAEQIVLRRREEFRNALRAAP